MSEHHTNSTRPMGLALKALMGCLAIATAAAQAATDTVSLGGYTSYGSPLRFTSASGSLQFSNGTIDPGTGLPGVPTTHVGGLVSALNVGKVEVTPVGDVTITEDILPIGGRVKTPTRANIEIEGGFSALTLDRATGQIVGAQFGGGARLTAKFLAGVGEGGEAVVSNLRLDLVGKKVYADLVSHPGTDAERTDLDVHLWSFESFTGPAALTREVRESVFTGQTAFLRNEGFTVLSTDSGGMVIRVDNLLKGLRVTTQGFNFFAGALGLTEGSTGYTTLNGVNSTADGWGSISSSMYFAPIPEPSTYALMGLGLVGVAAAARRRTKAEKVLG